MRELKFRVWLPSLQKLSYDSFMISPLGKVYVISNGDFISGKRHLWDLDDITETKDYILQQFTGLKDSAGKDIYEGDILKVTGYDDWFDENKYYYNTIVVFNVGGFKTKTNKVLNREGHDKYIGCDLFFHVNNKCEVVGNIFENPELLNE